MKSFKEFLSERLSSVQQTELRKVSKEELRDMILKGESIDEVDYSEVTNMEDMFYGCSSLKSIPHLDTSNVTDMYCMFDGCSSLKGIPKLDTSKVADMRGMFIGCSSIETIERPSDWYKYEWNGQHSPQHLKDKYPELYNKELR